MSRRVKLSNIYILDIYKLNNCKFHGNSTVSIFLTKQSKPYLRGVNKRLKLKRKKKIMSTLPTKIIIDTTTKCIILFNSKISINHK